MAKRLSSLEITELVTVHRGEPNRFVTPRWAHLHRRGLIHYADREHPRPRLTADAEDTLRRAGYLL